MRTSFPKPPAPSWYIIDAGGKHLGRLASHIAHVLHGKHKPCWSAHQVMSDHVIVTNAAQVVLAGEKLQKKVYRRHSGHFGHLKETTALEILQKNPAELLTRAVQKMLPRNRLRKPMLKHLHIYVGSSHPHEAQQPLPLEARPSSRSPHTSSAHAA